MKTTFLLFFAILFVSLTGECCGEGADQPRELSRWVRTEPLRLNDIPAPTQKLAARLRAMPAKAAFWALVEAWKEADSQLGTVEVERFGPPSGVYSKYGRWLRVRGKGQIIAFGKSRADAKISEWIDRKSALAVSDGANSSSARWGIRPDYVPWGYAMQSMAFPYRKFTSNSHEWFEYRREGDVLIVARRHARISRFWIDLRSLAVLAELYGPQTWYYVRHASGYRYMDGLPFPVPTKFVEERYRNADDQEPVDARVIQLQWSIEKETDREPSFPPEPTLTKPGLYHHGSWQYWIKKTRGRDESPERVRLLGEPGRMGDIGRSIVPRDPSPGDALGTAWGKMLWYDDDLLLGWFLPASAETVRAAAVNTKR